MRASTGGPLAAFLMVAPLVAIPVFAVVGIPQFAPAVSSAASEEDPSEPVVASGLVKAATNPPALAVNTNTKKPEDLFAPMDGNKASTGSGSSHKMDITARRESDNSEGSGRAQNSADQDGGIQWIPPAEALDGWDVATPTEKQSRKRLQETNREIARAPRDAEEPNLDDLPPSTLPKTRSAETPRPRNDGWSPESEEPAAPAPRKQNGRNSTSKKKKAAPGGSGFLTVPADQPPRSVAPSNSTPSRTAPATSGEKISLTNFTQGLVHPLDQGNTLPRARDPGSRSSPNGTTDLVLRPSDRKPLPMDRDEPLTWDAATARLKELGIQTYTLNAIDEGRYVFACQLNPTKSPKISRKFEDVADEPLLAVQKVLRQIDEWQSQR